HVGPALLCWDLIAVETPRIPPSSELDDALIRPTACVVKAADDRLPPETPGHRPRPRGHHHIGGEVLHVRRSREYSPNTYPEEVTVLTVDVRPFLQQDLVGPPHSPAVDLFRPPAGIAKLFLKLPRVPRRVPERKEHGLTIRQAPFGNFPDHVRHRRRLVKNIERGGVHVVLPCEGFRVLFSTSHRIHPPRLTVRGVVQAQGPLT